MKRIPSCPADIAKVDLITVVVILAAVNVVLLGAAALVWMFG